MHAPIQLWGFRHSISLTGKKSFEWYFEECFIFLFYQYLKTHSSQHVQYSSKNCSTRPKLQRGIKFLYNITNNVKWLMRRPSDRDLFFSFHSSRDLKEDFEFFKCVIGIILCILDVDTVINKSKPQIPITSHLVVFNSKMSLEISPVLLTSISLVCLVLFIHLFLSCTSACYCLSCANPIVSMVVS